MKDCKGKEIRTGDIVLIAGAYFQNDNGHYAVIHSPGDKGWSGADYCLKRIKRDGEPSAAKYNLCFWPIAIFAGGREKRLQAMAHNQKHATIEVVGHIKGDVERFRR